MSNKRRNSHWPLSVFSCIASLINVFIPLVLVRHLPSDSIGQYKVFFLYLSLIPLLSMSSGLINGIAFWSGQKHSKQAIHTTSMLLFGISLTVPLIVYLLSPQLQNLFGWSNQLALIFAIACYSMIPYSFYEEIKISQGKILHAALYFSFFEIVRSILVVAAAVYTGNLVQILWVHTIVCTIKVTMGFLGVTIENMDHKNEPQLGKLDWKLISSVLRYATPVSAAWIFGSLVNYADQCVLSIYLNPSEFAIYAIGCLAIPPILVYEQSVTRVLIPELSRLLNSRNVAASAEAYKRSVYQLGILIVPAVVGLFLFSKPIVKILFTDRYLDSVNYLQVFALNYLFLLFPYDAFARARGNSYWIFKYFCAFSIISLALTVLGLEYAGPMGALICLLTSRLLMRSYGIYYACKSEEISFYNLIPAKNLIRFLLFSGISACAVYSLKYWFSNDITWFFTGSLIYLMTYFSLTLLVKEQHPSSLKIHITQITQSIDIGGLEKILFYLARGINSSTDMQASVFCYDQDPRSTNNFSSKFEEENIAVFRYKKRKGFSLAAVVKLVIFSIQNQTQIFHVHDLGSLIYASLAKIICPYKVRIVYTQHSFLHLKRRKIYRFYEVFFSKFLSTLCVVSEEVLTGYEELGILKSKIQVIPNGVDFPSNNPHESNVKLPLRQKLIDSCPEPLNSKLSQCKDKIWILYLARLHQGKGHPQALHIWNKLEDNIRSQCCLIFVGPAPSQNEIKYIKELIQTSLDRDQIVYVPGTTDPVTWCQSSNLFLSCSESEGMPLAPLEAAGCGLPCLLSKIPGHEAFKACASYFDPKSDEEGTIKLTGLVSRIMKEEDSFYQETWNLSYELRESYSVKKMVVAYQRIYKRITNTSDLSDFSTSKEEIGQRTVSLV